MGEEKAPSRRRRPGARSGCGGGCASVIVVLTVGLLLSLFNTAIGLGVSVRIPFTGSNLSLAGSVGDKNKAPDALPVYLRGKLAGNENFVNQSNTLTIWAAEGTAVVVLGHQEGAPVIDLHLEAK